MSVPNEIERAERFSRKRARLLPVMGIVLIAQQAIISNDQLGDGGRTVDLVRNVAWAVFSIVLLVVLTRGGFWFGRRRQVRSLVEDELTQANRADALATGFIAAIAVGIVQFLVVDISPLSPRMTIHAIVTAGLASALIRFGYLERRSLA
jgi:hypothetical protein